MNLCWLWKSPILPPILSPPTWYSGHVFSWAQLHHDMWNRRKIKFVACKFQRGCKTVLMILNKKKRKILWKKQKNTHTKGWPWTVCFNPLCQNDGSIVLDKYKCTKIVIQQRLYRILIIRATIIKISVFVNLILLEF